MVPGGAAGLQNQRPDPRSGLFRVILSISVVRLVRLIPGFRAVRYTKSYTDRPRRDEVSQMGFQVKTTIGSSDEHRG